MSVSRTICLGFLAVILIGSIFLMMPFSLASGNWNNPIIALFTATSAVCVTGLSVVDVGKFYSFWGQLFTMLLVQVGGLGYMTATTVLLLLLRKRLALRDKIAIQQALDIQRLSGMANLVKSIIAVTLIFELTGVFLLLIIFVPQFGFLPGLWLSIFHSVNAFNNAGFGLFSDSLVSYVHNPLINGVISSLIILGGIGYQVIMESIFWAQDRITKRSKKTFFSLNFKITVSTTIILLLVGTIAILFTEFNNPNTLSPLNWIDKAIAAWFQSVTSRTAGFNTIDISKMTNAGLFITITLMFIGASPGSTGGGIKTTTFKIMIACTKAVLQGKEEVLSYQRQIPLSLILKAVSVFIGSAGLVMIGTILLTITDPKLNFIQLFFEVVSAFGTVGLSAIGTANISISGQLVLIGIMYIGRVGVLLLMSAILGDPKPSFVKYPEETLLVG